MSLATSVDAIDDAAATADHPADHRELVGAGAWLVSSFVVLSLANYAFSLAMSRKLSIEDYGSFGVVSSVLLLEGLVATAGFPWVLSTLVSRHGGSEGRTVRAQALGVAVLGNAGVGVLTGVAVALVTLALVARHPLAPWLLAITAFATCINAVWYGLYQGERRFPLLAGLRSGEAVIKVTLGTGLVVLGLGLNGAIAGSAIAACCMLVWGATRVRAFSWPSREILSQTQNLRAVGWTTVAQLGLALLMNMDILGVRGLGHGPSSAVGAGYYQAAAVLARAPVLVGLAVLGAGFPFLARDAADRENERRLVRMMVRVLALGPLPIAVVLAAAPHAAIGFFFPASYAPAIGLLRLTAVAAFPLIALALVVTCLQALDSMKRASAAIVPAVILEAVLLVILVPRDGATGAAWAALLAATLSAVVALLLAPRRWAAPVLSQLAPLAGGWAVLAFVTSVWQVPAPFWIPSAILLYAMFLLVVWALGGLSLAELVSIAPPFMRGPMAGLARRESGWRSR